MSYLAPVLFVALVWWVSTALLLRRALQPAASYRGTMLGAVLAAVLGGAAMLLSRDGDSVIDAYLAFSAAIGIWAMLESSYLLGFVTGPRPAACPPGVAGFRRFVYGVRASLYHELSIIVAAALIGIAVIGHANPVAFWTFVALWLMRWSTKLNIFLGVRNLHAEFWPSHLQYLRSYVRDRSGNALFPVSIFMIGAAIAVQLAMAIAAEPGFVRASSLLLATILLLGLAEHLFLMLRVPDATLWRPATGSRRGAG